MSDRLKSQLSSAFVAAFLEDDPEDLYENAPCAYLSAAPDGTIAKANATFLRWTGYEEGDLLGRMRWQDLLRPGDRIFYETHFAPLLRLQGTAREIALDIIGADDQRLPVLVNAAMKLSPDGEPLVTRLVLFDARERRAYEAELLAARVRAEESEQRAATLARTLQASLLPRELVRVPGLDVGAAYRPAGDGSQVGGDFYDVVEVSPTSWAFVMGDVCGKGPGAAVLTSLARDTIRHELLRTDDPAAVLGAVRDVMLRYHPSEFCTAVMVVVTATEQGLELRTSMGGHHPPLLRHADGTFERVGSPGPLLGLIDHGTPSDHRATLSPGDTITLYTDGVHEARRGREFFEHERVRRTIEESASADAQSIADAVVDAAVTFQSGHTRDDMAVLVVKVL